MDIKKLLKFISIVIIYMVLIPVCKVKADTTSGFWSYEEYKDGTVGITAYSGLDGDIVIPSEIEGKTVTKIANNAFRNNKNIKNVIIPSTVTTIGHQAFAGSGLVSVVIPDSVSKWEFKSWSGLPSGAFEGNVSHSGAFAECKSLKNVTIGSEIIPKTCFFNCIELINVICGEKTKYIQDQAFEENRSLNQIIIKSDLIEIGNKAFRNCKSLTGISLGNELQKIGHQAFAGSGLIKISIPETVINWVTSSWSGLPSGGYSGNTTHSSAFAECSSLKEVVIESETIPLFCFYKCEELTNVIFGENTKYIKERAFEDARKLSVAIVKSNLLEIGKKSFRNCSSLKNISLGNELQKIGHQAFAGSGLISISIPETVVNWESSSWEELPSGAFSGNTKHCSPFAECKSLKEVVIESETIPLYCFYNCNELTSVVFGKKTKYVHERAFENARKLKIVSVKSDLLEIGKKSFRNCESLNYISLGNKLKRVGHQAFAGSGLIMVSIPDTINDWETSSWDALPSGAFSGSTKHCSAFAECKNLKDVYIGNTSIPEKLLYGSNSVTIHCMQDTSAYNYAINNGLSYKIHESIPSTLMELVTKEYTLVLGDKLRLHPIMTPANSTDTVSWVTGNANIATVDTTGLVNAKTTGLVAMKCITSSGQSYTFSINIVSSGETTVDNEPAKDISLSIVGNLQNKEYTGEPIIQDVNVKFNMYTELIEGVHYTVQYQDNVEMGTATVVIEAIDGSGYEGQIIETFEITAFTGMRQIDGIWYYLSNSVVDKKFVGLAKNDYGWWYIKNGTIDFTYTGLAKNDYGWFYVKKGKLDTTYTGLAKNDYGWWYVKKGKLDTTYTGLAKNDYGWFYVKKGKLDTSYTGMAKNDYGWWYVKKGKIDKTYTGMAKNQYGWWYLKNGTIDKKYTGLAKNQYGWFYMKNGKLDTSYTRMAKNQYGWWHVTKGKVDTSYTGISTNAYGMWYIKKGKLDTTFSGTVKYNGVTYAVKSGKVEK